VRLYDVQEEVMKILLQHMYGCLERVPLEHALLVFSASDRSESEMRVWS
jgi:hypothetical protein